MASKTLVSATVLMCALLPIATATIADQVDPILFRYSGDGLYDGAFGPLHEVQEAARVALTQCRSPVVAPTDGRMNRGTRAAFKAVASCTDFTERLSQSSEARDGAITTNLWMLLLPKSAPPSAIERARTIMLTFEATDYTRLEWNFCQSRPLYDPEAGRKVCYSNDPNSFITWGPNGATAGGGREVQAILAKISSSYPKIIPAAFGQETDAVMKLVKLRAGGDTEVFLCGIWANAKRRSAWRAGFEQLGAHSGVRDTYDEVYRSSSFDGGKIATFVRAYEAIGLKPSEIDYAFFKDRAAHMTVVYPEVAAAVKSVADSDPGAPHWKVRRSIALDVRPSQQREDRLGRDVAFYVDGLDNESLGEEEKAAWTKRGSIRASDLGLSDKTASAAPASGPPILSQETSLVALTDADRSACPRAVLDTQRPGH